jgi:hypothetical protein
VATQLYEVGGPRLHVPSRNTGRGVHGCGELKAENAGGEGKPKCLQSVFTDERLSLKGLGVTAMKLEAERSSPGQDEAGRKPGGGPKGC